MSSIYAKNLVAIYTFETFAVEIVLEWQVQTLY